jgi:hypothetical protein
LEPLKAFNRKRSTASFEVREAKMSKPKQSNISVLGAGVGVLTFVAGDRQLSPNAMIAAAIAARALRSLDLPSANENERETDFWERPLRVGGVALRQP